MQNGYEETTVAQIADRAGLNRATFFRHFADKREVLFGGEDVLGDTFAEAIRAAPAAASVAECLSAALEAAGTVMTPAQRHRAAQRRRIAGANAEVQERGLLKSARVVASVVAALRERGADELTARFGAEMMLLAFASALRDWSEAEADAPFASYAASAFAALQARARVLAAEAPTASA